jgi:ubiquinone/menaquinone biosynthesis C-methylase UbiE
MPFLEESFTTVTLSNALHHIVDHSKLFTEMIRVCRPDGFILVNEMINDSASEFQESHISYHHYISELDNLLGHYHRETYSEKELLNLIKEYDLKVSDSFCMKTAQRIVSIPVKLIECRPDEPKVSLLKNTDSYYFY